MLTIQSLNLDVRLAVTIAIFFAEDALPIWEKQYPEDIRPRKAIEAAKVYLASPCLSTADAAYAAAAHAADASDSAALRGAAGGHLDANANAADAATYAADAAVRAAYAADAAYAASSANAAANSAAAATHIAYASVTLNYGSDRKLYIHSKLAQLLPHLFEYKVFTKTSFKDSEQVFDLLSEKNQQRFLFNLNSLR
tara:strand:- start:2447 stop:3037 length:591 start_codon:yes stop_codon:yes gene_type:complete